MMLTREDLIDEITRLAELHAGLETQARMRSRDIVNALTIREVDNTARFKLAIHEKQMDRLYQWR